ncbi:MAG: hypothetical protein QOK43_1984 [Acidimicrobiaceae bacterium]|nr:hypothetical protein [Acidimicrobiaceae bacterium]
MFDRDRRVQFQAGSRTVRWRLRQMAVMVFDNDHERNGDWGNGHQRRRRQPSRAEFELSSQPVPQLTGNGQSRRVIRNPDAQAISGGEALPALSWKVGERWTVETGQKVAQRPVLDARQTAEGCQELLFGEPVLDGPLDVLGAGRIG